MRKCLQTALKTVACSFTACTLPYRRTASARHNIFCMRITKQTLKSTFFSLLGFAEAPSSRSQAALFEQLRQAMLATLGDEGSENFVRVSRKLRYAGDVTGLWYARSDLMRALSAMHGELWAHQTLEELDARFRVLLPTGMKPCTVHKIIDGSFRASNGR